MITADTERLVRRWFVCQPIDLGGLGRAGAIYRVLGEGTQAKSLSIGSSKATRPWSGMEETTTAAVSAWISETGQEPEVVTVCGGQGGKTRLTYVRADVRLAGHLRAVHPGQSLSRHGGPAGQTDRL